MCFVGHYGNTWTARFKEETTLELTHREWCRRLGGLTRDQIAEGWHRCGQAHPTFPPTPSEFRRLCVPSPAYAAGVPQLPQITRDRRSRLEGAIKALEDDTTEYGARVRKRMTAKLKEIDDE